MLNNSYSKDMEEEGEQVLDHNDNGALLNINVRLSSEKTSTLTIYENDIIEDRVDAFCKKHKLNKQIRDMLTQQVITQLDSQITELEENEKETAGNNTNKRLSVNEGEKAHQSFSSFGLMSQKEAKANNNTNHSNDNDYKMNNTCTKIEEEKQTIANISDESFTEILTPKYIINDNYTNTKTNTNDNDHPNKSNCLDNFDLSLNNSHYKEPNEKSQLSTNTIKKTDTKGEQGLKQNKPKIQKNTTNGIKANKGVNKQIEKKPMPIQNNRSKNVSMDHSPSKKVFNNSKIMNPSQTTMNLVSKSRSKSKDNKQITNIKPISVLKANQTQRQLMTPIKLSPSQKIIHSPNKKIISKSPSAQSKTPTKQKAPPIKPKNNDNEERIEIIKMKIKKYKEIFDLLDSDKDGIISLKSIRLSILNKDLLQAFTPILEDLQKNGSQMEFKEFCLKVDRFLTMKALSS